MNVSTFLTDLRSRDVQISIEGDRLRCNAPKGAISDELRFEIQQRKDEILEFIRIADSVSGQQNAVVPMQPFGSRIPVFAAGGHNADIFAFQDFVRNLRKDQPFYGLHPPGLDDEKEPFSKIEELAEYYADEIQSKFPSGPYIVAGYCAGGAISLELARKLQNRGEVVSFLTLFGCTYPTDYRILSRLSFWIKRILKHLNTSMKSSSVTLGTKYLLDRVRGRIRQIRTDNNFKEMNVKSLQKKRFEKIFMRANRRYKPKSFNGKICLINPNKESLRNFAPQKWEKLGITTKLYIGPDNCNVDEMLNEPDAQSMVELFNKAYTEFKKNQ